MSVLINMEMPKCCAECDAEGYYENSYGIKYGFFCHLGSKEYTEDTRDTKRLNNCPLAPVPPHGRLGDLDKLENDLRHMAKYQYGERQQGILGCCETIRTAPTIILASKEGE